MEQRDLRQPNHNLWDYKYFSRKVKRHYGLNERSHIRYDERRVNGNGINRCLVYVIRRSEPNAGFDFGNFAVCVDTLRRLTEINVSSAYVALVEDFVGTILTWDTAKNVRRELRHCDPYVGNNGNQYIWVTERLMPLHTTNMVGERIDEPPF